MNPLPRRNFLRTTAVAGGALLLRPWAGVRAAADGRPELSSYERRRKWVLDAVVAEPLKTRELFWAAQACFLRGKNELGLQVWRKAVAHEEKARVRGVELFNYWPAIHGLAKWSHLLTPADTESIKAILTQFREYKDMRTSNLHTLACVTRYLAGQVFGERDFANEAHYRPNDPNAAAALRKLLEKNAREGFGEWASWPYYDKNLLPVASLAELAADADIRRRAQVAFEAGLIQNAPFWLQGRWVMPSGRSYPDILSQQPWGSTQTLWLYFGGPTPPADGHLIGAAVMEYALPEALERVADDRAKAFSARSHFGDGYQMSFLDRDYGLFCEMQGDKIRDWWQSYPYGVMWNDANPAHTSFLWLTAPMNDAPAENSPSHPHGIYSRAQSNLQHQDALLYVFEFPQPAAHPYALGFIPGGALAVVDDAAASGQIFLHYPGVLMAISSTQPFGWDRTAPVRAPSGHPNPGDSEFRVAASPLAMAIECAHPDDFSGATAEDRLAVFRQQIRRNSALNLNGLAGRYVDRKGNVLERTFHGAASVNGTSVDFAGWPVLDSPWTRQMPGGNLVVTSGRERREYDFEKWTIRDNR